MIDECAEALWQAYLAAEKERVRGVFLPALERFIDHLLTLPAAEWHGWAKKLAARHSDEEADLPVRFPLFRRVLLPALADGVLNREPGCARWLAQFEQMILNSTDYPLPSHLRSAAGLLREAIRIDGDDNLARLRLLERTSAYLEYSLHELPAGVLYGYDGATPEQCDDLLGTLDDFRTHVMKTGQSDRFQELINECDFHYHAYRRYRQDNHGHPSYESFLDSLEQTD